MPAIFSGEEFLRNHVLPSEILILVRRIDQYQPGHLIRVLAGVEPSEETTY